MNFNELTANEKAAKTYRDLLKRKEEKELGKKAAEDHLYENSYRIQKAVRDIKKRRKPIW